MKRLLTISLFFICTINIFSQSKFINNKNDLPLDLKKYYYEAYGTKDIEDIIQILSNDTLSFCFDKSSLKYIDNIRLCGYDTIWIKDIKNKKKAKKDKHYKLEAKKLSFAEIESKLYKIFKTEKRSDYHYSYLDIYLHNIHNLADSIVWTHNFLHYYNPEFRIKSLNATRLAHHYFAVQENDTTYTAVKNDIYYITGNKKIQTNYKKVKCIDCDFYINSYDFTTHFNRTFIDTNGEKYTVSDFNGSFISKEEFDYNLKHTIVEPTKYDSLTNVQSNRSKEPYSHLIGQEITAIDADDYSVYISYFGNTKMNLKNMENNTYTIIGVDQNALYLCNKNNPKEQGSLYIDSYHSYAGDYSFVCSGYIEKIKQLYLGKELVYINDDSGNGYISYATKDRFMDYETNRNLDKRIPRYSTWKCTGVSVLKGKKWFSDLEENRVILDLENEKFGNYYIFASTLFWHKKNGYDKFLTKEEYNIYKAKRDKEIAKAKAEAEKRKAEAAEQEARRIERIKKENTPEIANLILRGEIRIGMTKRQCKDAIGEPRRVNRTTTATSTREQWVYYNKYLYFENGVLVTIQD